MVGDLRSGEDLESADRSGIGDEQVAGVPYRLDVARAAGVGGADQIDEACFAEDVERFAVRQQVEIAAQDGEVAGLADVGDQRGEAFGLGSSGRGVVLALGVTQPVNLDDGDGSCPALEREPRRERVARPTAIARAA